MYHNGDIVLYSAFSGYLKSSEVVLKRLSTIFLLKGTFHHLLPPFPSQAQHTHDAITEAAQLMKEAVDDIMVTLNEAASEVGLVGGMVDAIAEAMSKVGLGFPKLPSPLTLLPPGFPTDLCFSLKSPFPLFLRVLITVQMRYHLSNIFILHCSLITMASQLYPSFQFYIWENGDAEDIIGYVTYKMKY